MPKLRRTLVGAHWCAMLLLCLRHLEQELSSSLRRASSFLSLAREKGTKERGTPLGACRASGNRSCVASTPASMPSPAQQVREPWPGFSTGHPALAKRSRPRATAPALPQLRHPCRRHVGSRCAACRPRLTAAQGPRVEQRAIVARTFQKSQSNAKAMRGLFCSRLDSSVRDFDSGVGGGAPVPNPVERKGLALKRRYKH
jgi:hypothetical protein